MEKKFYYITPSWEWADLHIKENSLPQKDCYVFNHKDIIMLAINSGWIQPGNLLFIFEGSETFVEPEYIAGLTVGYDLKQVFLSRHDLKTPLKEFSAIEMPSLEEVMQIGRTKLRQPDE